MTERNWIDLINDCLIVILLLSVGSCLSGHFEDQTKHEKLKEYTKICETVCKSNEVSSVDFNDFHCDCEMTFSR